MLRGFQALRKYLIILAMLSPVAGWPPAMAAQDDGGMLMDVAKRPVPAHNFKSVLADGRNVQLSDYKGKIVFLNFWATWCIPCVHEMPAMERLAQQMKGKPFVIVAVNMMEPLDVVKKFVVRLKLTYDIVMDESGDIGGAFDATNLPLTYIIDKQGNIIRRAIGARIWDKKESVALFQKLAAR